MPSFVTAKWVGLMPLAVVLLWQERQFVVAVNELWSGLALVTHVDVLWHFAQSLPWASLPPIIAMWVAGRATAFGLPVSWQLAQGVPAASTPE